jgi:hypothetical protein
MERFLMTKGDWKCKDPASDGLAGVGKKRAEWEEGTSGKEFKL